MKAIYLTLINSGSLPSNIIKLYKKQTYCHITISLDISLDHMYSFSRKHPYFPLYAGFVEEGKNSSFYKRFIKTECKVYEIKISNFKYYKLSKIIKDFKKNQSLYKYNILGVIFVPLNINIKRKYHYYCSEFVRFLFITSNINKKIPNMISPEELVDFISNKKLIYEGLLKNYKPCDL